MVYCSSREEGATEKSDATPAVSRVHGTVGFPQYSVTAFCRDGGKQKCSFAEDEVAPHKNIRSKQACDAIETLVLSKATLIVRRASPRYMALSCDICRATDRALCFVPTSHHILCPIC